MFAEEDKKKREIIDTKNLGDSLVYQTLKQLSEFDEKLPKELKDQVEGRVKELEEAMKTDEVSRMKESIDNLQKEVVNIGKAMYSQQGDASGVQAATNVGSE